MNNNSLNSIIHRTKRFVKNIFTLIEVAYCNRDHRHINDSSSASPEKSQGNN